MLLLLLALVAAPPHVTESFAVLSGSDGDLELRLTVNAAALVELLGQLDPEAEPWDGEDLGALELPAFRYLLERYRMWAGTRELQFRGDSLRLDWGEDRVLRRSNVPQLTATFRAEGPPGDFELAIEQTLFLESEVGHVHVLQAQVAGEPELYPVLAEQRATLWLEQEGAEGRQWRARTWYARGVSGFLRLVAPLLFCAMFAAAAASRREMLWLGLCATAAAALSFHASTAGWIRPSPTASHAAAAFSVAYLAAENLFARDLKLRGATVALFGLVQGLLFATHYQSLQQPSATPLLNGLSFEAGTLTVLWATLLVGGALCGRIPRAAGRGAFSVILNGVGIAGGTLLLVASAGRLGGVG